MLDSMYNMLRLCSGALTHVLIAKGCPCIVMSVLQHVKHFKALCSLNTKANTNFSRKYWLTYWHQSNSRCNRRLMHEIDLLLMNFNRTTVYAQLPIACNWRKLRMYADTVNKGMNRDLMVVGYH